ncbi:MAG: hypothetical protein ACTSQI_21425 [Candidatus Helarchaeota archaeon]
MTTEKEVINELYTVVKDGANPREAREAINTKFPDWNDSKKLRKIIPKVKKMFAKPRILKFFLSVRIISVPVGRGLMN